MGNTRDGYYKRKPYRDDGPIKVDLVRSVLEMRKVYASLTEREFASMYVYKYRASGLKVADVLEILNKKQEYDAAVMKPEIVK